MLSDFLEKYEPLLTLSFEETDNISEIPFFFKQSYYLGDYLIDLWFEVIEVPT